MVYESLCLEAMGILGGDDVARLIRCLEAYDLPTKVPLFVAQNLNKVCAFMARDKKNRTSDSFQDYYSATQPKAESGSP